jgi:hypothetical protein
MAGNQSPINDTIRPDPVILLGQAPSIGAASARSVFIQLDTTWSQFNSWRKDTAHDRTQWLWKGMLDRQIFLIAAIARCIVH